MVGSTHESPAQGRDTSKRRAVPPRRRRPPDRKPTLLDRLEQLGKLRDGMLVTAAFLYVLGYGVWALYALRHSLGPLPALEFQYLVAGVGPALFLAALVLTIQGVRWLRSQVMVWLAPDVTGWRRTLRVAIFVIFFASLLSAVLVGNDPTLALLEAHFGDFFAALFLIALTVAFLASAVFLPPVADLSKERVQTPRDSRSASLPFKRLLAVLQRYRSAWSRFAPARLVLWVSYGLAVAVVFVVALLVGIVRAAVDEIRSVPGELSSPHSVNIMRRLSELYAFFLVAVLTVAGIAFFVLEVYPAIPQELGGPRPRCAELDVAGADLAPQTRMALVPGETTEAMPPVVRTVPVDVFFVTGDFMLVSPRGDGALSGRPIYEIRKGVVEAISWCP